MSMCVAMLTSHYAVPTSERNGTRHAGEETVGGNFPCAAPRWMLSCSLDQIKKLKKYNCSPTFQATREIGEDIKQHNKSNTIKSLNIVVFSDMASLIPKIVAICEYP